MMTQLPDISDTTVLTGSAHVGASSGAPLEEFDILIEMESRKN